MATSKEFFTTEQVVELLGLKPKDKWRIIKFVEGKEYGIEPAMVMGKGLGSRRLYNLENVCEIAVALAFLEAGLRPAVIGEVLPRLPRMENKLREEHVRDLHVIAAFEQRFGRLLNKSRLVSVDLTTTLYSPEAVRESLWESYREMSTGDFAILYIPIGSLFSGISGRLERMKAERD